MSQRSRTLYPGSQAKMNQLPQHLTKQRHRSTSVQRLVPEQRAELLPSSVSQFAVISVWTHDHFRPQFHSVGCLQTERGWRRSWQQRRWCPGWYPQALSCSSPTHLWRILVTLVTEQQTCSFLARGDFWLLRFFGKKNIFKQALHNTTWGASS